MTQKKLFSKGNTNSILKLTAAILFLQLVLFYPCLVQAEEKKPVRITPTDVAQAIALKDREETVTAKEKELADWEQELIELKTDIDKKLARLVAMQGEIKIQLEDIKAIQTKEFKNLIKMYSTMSASKVAPMLNKMENVEVVKILRSMKFDLAAKILPKMNQDKAVAVSKSLGMLDKKIE